MDCIFFLYAKLQLLMSTIWSLLLQLEQPQYTCSWPTIIWVSWNKAFKGVKLPHVSWLPLPKERPTVWATRTKGMHQTAKAKPVPNCGHIVPKPGPWDTSLVAHSRALYNFFVPDTEDGNKTPWMVGSQGLVCPHKFKGNRRPSYQFMKASLFV